MIRELEVDNHIICCSHRFIVTRQVKKKNVFCKTNVTTPVDQNMLQLNINQYLGSTVIARWMNSIDNAEFWSVTVCSLALVLLYCNKYL